VATDTEVIAEPMVESRRLGHALRGVPLATIVLLVIAIAGLPLFLCRGQTIDSTFFDVCAHVVLSGKRPYEELFLHGPPGMLWPYALIRSVGGWRVETLRAVDITIVMLELALCISLGLRGSGHAAARLWTFAILLGFYMSTTEWSHCETDVWMFLPAMLALYLRVERVQRLKREEETASGVLVTILEGILWGLAFLMKPYVIIPAACAWLAGMAALIRAGVPARRMIVDLAAVVLGGLLVGAGTVAWLLASGNWKGFWSALLWNQDYLERRMYLIAHYKPMIEKLWPWSLVQLAAIPAALHSIARQWMGREDENGLVRSIVSAAYLGFVFEANLLQQQFDYHLVPIVFLGIALLAGTRFLRLYIALGFGLWVGTSFLCWLLIPNAIHHDFWREQMRSALWPGAIIGFCWFAGDRIIRPITVIACLAWLVAHHPLLSAEKRVAWTQVWHEGSTPQIRNVLNEEDYSAPDWVELKRVADYLRQRGVGDRELLCYSFSAVPLYTQLHVQPATRFVLLWSMIAYFRHHLKDMAREVADSPARFVVNDLRMLGLTPQEAKEVIPADMPLTLRNLSAILQKMFPEQRPILTFRGEYPWSEPMVFHTGQYVVHEVRPRNLRGKNPLPLWWLKK
jgi:hypothetical protein